MSTQRTYHPPCASPAQHDAQARRQIASEQAMKRAREDVISYLEGGHCDIEDLIPLLDGDGITLLCKVLLRAYRDGVACTQYSDAEQLVDALAQAEADREMQA